MLTLNYNSKSSNNSVLLGDADIEGYLLSSIKLTSTSININQISIIYVLRKLIAQKRINPTDVSVSIENVVYVLNDSGRFVHYPPGDDLFDDCLNAILKG